MKKILYILIVGLISYSSNAQTSTINLRAQKVGVFANSANVDSNLEHLQECNFLVTANYDKSRSSFKNFSFYSQKELKYRIINTGTKSVEEENTIYDFVVVDQRGKKASITLAINKELTNWSFVVAYPDAIMIIKCKVASVN